MSLRNGQISKYSYPTERKLAKRGVIKKRREADKCLVKGSESVNPKRFTGGWDD